MRLWSNGLTEQMTDMRKFFNQLIAWEISRITRYSDRVIQVDRLDFDDGLLLDLLDCPHKDSVASCDLQSLGNHDTLLLNGNFNHHYDVQGILQSLYPCIQRSSRLVAVLFNPYLEFLFRIANTLGIRKGDMPTTFLTRPDLHTIAKLAEFEVVRLRNVGFIPFRMLGLGTMINRILAALPLLKWSSLANVVVLRPVKRDSKPPSLSIVVPARNEAGNIENALRRMPELPCKTEIIYVEGHSTDNTWKEIERVCATYKGRFDLKRIQQHGKGKCDAVRHGFASASGELLTILDADLTMPPEKLPYFYEAYRTGKADFINGSRLLYPMEGQAMRPLNKMGNVLFARLLSWVLGQKLTDSLCGTKLIRRDDYIKLTKWRQEFGDFDPFGDFELLFFAASTGIGSIDVPIRYMDRTYGATNISRFRHGLMLFKMTWVGLTKITVGGGNGRNR